MSKNILVVGGGVMIEGVVSFGINSLADQLLA